MFVISATYAPGHWDDVIAVSRLARKIQLLLPGYPGQVQPGDLPPVHVDAARASGIGPTITATGSARGWSAATRVVEWLEHFGTEHGLSAGRSRALR